MTLSASIQAELWTLTPAYGLAAVTVLAVPPSSVDPWPNEERVRIQGAETFRSIDPDIQARP